MKKYTLLCIWIAVVLGKAAEPPSIEALMTEFRVPGLAVGWIHDQQEETQTYGVTTMGGTEKIDTETLFAIGSITKTMTGLLALQYVMGGNFPADVRVLDLDPNFRHPQPQLTATLTLGQLLSHASNLARHDLMWEGEVFSRAEIYKRLQHLPALEQDQPQFHYSNLNYLAAGQAMAQHTGQDWEQAVHAKIFGPLNMTRTYAQIDTALQQPNLARPHTIDSDQLQQVPQFDRAVQHIAPAGSVYSNLVDMLKYARFWLNGNQATPLEALSECWTPRTLIPHYPSDLLPERGLVGYGYGWLAEWYRGHYIVYHSGVVNGFSAQFLLVPKQKLGIVVLSNRFGNPLPDIVSRRIMETQLGMQPIDWSTFYRQMDQSQTAAEQKAQASEPEAQPMPATLKLAGRYSHPGYGLLECRQAGEKWHVAYGKNTGTITYLGLNHLRLHFETPKGSQVMDAFIQSNAQNQVTGLNLNPEPTTAAITFQKQ